MTNKFLLALGCGVLSFFCASAQQQRTETLSSSFKCGAVYKKGENAYLMDSCSVNFTFKKIVGKIGLAATGQWTAKPEFVYNKVKINRSELTTEERMGDVLRKFDLISPKSAEFDVMLMFYSEKAKCYFASAKTRIKVPYMGRAGMTVAPETFDVSNLKGIFSDVVVGKQTKPGVVISDASLKDFLSMCSLTEGKVDMSAKGSGMKVNSIFINANRVDVASATIVNLNWDKDEYAYIVDEVTRRKETSALLAKGDSAGANKKYFDNRKYPITISEKSSFYWSTTVVPFETWIKCIDDGDKYFKQQKWNEASICYNMAVQYDTTVKYPLNQIAMINNYLEYKNNRNVTGVIDLVYVEGNGDVKSFYIGKTEVTQSQWKRVMGTNPSHFNGCRDCPVENVSWNEVEQFIKKLNEQTGTRYRLLSEKEWEYAAKGGKNGFPTDFAGGQNIDEVSWCAYNSDQTTHSCGTKQPNELGIYDMTGNVAEWVNNQYDKVTRFAKGGSFSDDASGCVINAKEAYKPDYKSKNVGFRLCQDE